MSTEEIIPTVWSNIYPGQRVRWTTPTFVRRGTVLRIKGRGMEVQFDGLARSTRIPDARWYFCEGLAGNVTEQLVVVTGKPASTPKALKRTQAGKDWGTELITPAEAANILGVDQKTLRRMLRTGKVPGHQEGGRWVLIRSDVQKVKR